MNKEERKEYAHNWYKQNREKMREYGRLYYQEHKEEMNKRGIIYNREYRASLPLEKKQEMTRKAHLNWRIKHPDRYEARKLKNKEYNLQIKYEILAYYSNGKDACVKCGESRIACLSIDHINGGERAHNREIGKRGGTFYRWLKKEGYPEGYQTLCMNCQWVKKSERNENARGTTSGGHC